METKFLEEIGLTKGESKVYLTLLALGPSTTGRIIKDASVSRSKVYEMLDKLIKHGLVSYSVRENIKYYDATSPEILTKLLRKKQIDIEKQQKNLDQTIYNLLKIRGSRTMPQTASVYEGMEGIRSIYNLILENLKTGDEYFAFQTEHENFDGEFVKFIQNYHKRRAKKRIGVRLLGSDETRSKVLKSLGKISGIQIRFTSKPLPTSTLVFGDRVATFVWGDDAVGIVMQSKQIAARYKKFFSYLWNSSKK